MSKYNFGKNLKHNERALVVIDGIEMIPIHANYSAYAGREARVRFFIAGTKTPGSVCRGCGYSIIYFHIQSCIWACEMCEGTRISTAGHDRKVLAFFIRD